MQALQRQQHANQDTSAYLDRTLFSDYSVKIVHSMKTGIKMTIIENTLHNVILNEYNRMIRKYVTDKIFSQVSDI